jgi:hypothetical protein
MLQQHLHILFCALFLINLSSGSAAQLETAPGWVKDITPKKGLDMEFEIHCYAFVYPAFHHRFR